MRWFSKILLAKFMRCKRLFVWLIPSWRSNATSSHSGHDFGTTRALLLPFDRVIVESSAWQASSSGPCCVDRIEDSDLPLICDDPDTAHLPIR